MHLPKANGGDAPKLRAKHPTCRSLDVGLSQHLAQDVSNIALLAPLQTLKMDAVSDKLDLGALSTLTALRRLTIFGNPVESRRYIL